LTSYDYDETISVLVGPEKVKFTAHRDVLSDRSQYFNTACSQRWLEGQQKVVPLPEFEPETFQMYMDLTYNRLVYPETSRALPLVKFYVLVDYLDDVKARNRTMELLLCRMRCPSPETVAFLWDHTAQGSLLRQWAVDAVSAILEVDKFARMVGSYPAEFVQQIAVNAYRFANIPYPSEGLVRYLDADVEDEE
jgi:hypothetical protein